MRQSDIHSLGKPSTSAFSSTIKATKHLSPPFMLPSVFISISCLSHCFLLYFGGKAFHQAAAMKFSPTKAELQSSHSDLPSSPSDLMNPNLYVSGSKWGAIHLKALRVVSWDDMEISKLIPNKYLPHHNSTKGKAHPPRGKIKRKEDAIINLVNKFSI